MGSIFPRVLNGKYKCPTLATPLPDSPNQHFEGSAFVRSLSWTESLKALGLLVSCFCTSQPPARVSEICALKPEAQVLDRGADPNVHHPTGGFLSGAQRLGAFHFTCATYRTGRKFDSSFKHRAMAKLRKPKRCLDMLKQVGIMQAGTTCWQIPNTNCGSAP